MALINNKNPFDPHISSRRLNEDINFQFDRGWSPILGTVLVGDKVHLVLRDWQGGEGEKPFDPSVGGPYYIGDAGYVIDINLAVNIAEHFLTDDNLEDLIDVSSMTFDFITAGDGITKQLRLEYNTRDTTPSIPVVHTFNANILTNSNTLIDYISENGSDDVGSTVLAISKALYSLRNWLIIDDSSPVEPWETEQGMSQNAIMTAINDAKAQFDVPILNLDIDLITEIEQTSNITEYNPYYLIVREDERTDGRHTSICTITCVQQCCDLNTDGGYEERGNRDGITGCRCDAGIEEVLAECLITVVNAGVDGDRHEIWLNDEFYAAYDVVAGDTTSEVVIGLINNIGSSCGDVGCTVLNQTSNSFVLRAPIGSGSDPNSWNKFTVTTGSAQLTIDQLVIGVDYLPATYRGVRHHLIAYDGNEWYDFGPTLAFGNNNEDPESCICTFLSQTDTPNSYVGFAGYVPIVNTLMDALEFIDFTFLNLHDTPTTYTINHRVKVDPTGNSLIFVDDSIVELNDVDDVLVSNTRLKVNNAGTLVEFINDTFLELNDVVDTSYTGNATFVPSVNTLEDGLEFVDPQSLVNNTFIGLTDTPSTYVEGTGTTDPLNPMIVINTTNDGLIFAPTPTKVENNNVILNEDTYILQPQHFKFEDDTEDTTGWGIEHAGRMRFIRVDHGAYETQSLQVWSIDNNGVYGWQNAYHATTI